MDVLVVGGGIGGLAAYAELRSLGLDALLVSDGPLGGHLVDEGPLYDGSDPKSLLSRYSVDSYVRGHFDGRSIMTDGGPMDVNFKYVIYGGGAFDAHLVFIGNGKVRQLGAEEALRSGDVSGRRIVVWGTTHWGLRTAIALARRGAEVVVMDNSMYLRDHKYYSRHGHLLEKLGVEVMYGVRIEGPGLQVAINRGKQGVERRVVRADMVVSSVRVPRAYTLRRMGLRLTYAPEAGGLTVRRHWQGLTERGDVYVVGEVYGALYEHLTIEQARLAALHVALREGLVDSARYEKALGEFKARLVVDAPAQHNLSVRMDVGLQGSGIYVEPNVADVPFWASLTFREAKEQVACPCDGSTLKGLVDYMRSRLGLRDPDAILELRVTHDDADRLRSVTLPGAEDMARHLGWRDGRCVEETCLYPMSMLLGFAVQQKPSKVLYGGGPVVEEAD